MAKEIPKKVEKMANFAEFLSENPDFLEQFKNIEAADLKGLTQPSIVLKGGVGELDVSRLSPKQIEQYLLLHPVIPRGIDIRANRMTGRGYTIKPYDESPKAKEAAEKMSEIIDDSGGEILLNSWIKDAFGFGNGYLTLMKDKSSDEVVMLSKEHPIFFRIARFEKENSKDPLLQNTNNSDWDNKYGGMKINPVTKQPDKYTQVVFNSDKTKVQPFGTELTADQVAHLVFDTWGDEAEGIGLIQYVHNVLKYLMNIEEAGAEAIFRSGFTQKKVTTEIMTEKDLKKLAKNLQEINTSDAIILPKGTNVENLQPGQTQFEQVHDIFLNLIAIRLGIPKPILTLDGTDTNKATMRELMRDLFYDLRSDEIKVARTIEEQIFKPACQSIFGDEFELTPKFMFNDFEEGKEEKATVLAVTSDYVTKFTAAYEKLAALGQTEAAQQVLEVMMRSLAKSSSDSYENSDTSESVPKVEVPKPPEEPAKKPEKPAEKPVIPEEQE